MKDIESALHDREFGWFIRAATESFAFLTDEFGFDRPTAYLHFRGTFVGYRGNDCSVDIEIDPESRYLDVTIASGKATEAATRTNVWDLLAQRAPNEEWYAPPRQRGLDDNGVITLLRHWAEGIRRLASDVLENCGQTESHD